MLPPDTPQRLGAYFLCVSVTVAVDNIGDNLRHTFTKSAVKLTDKAHRVKVFVTVETSKKPVLRYMQHNVTAASERSVHAKLVRVKVYAALRIGAAWNLRR